MCLILWVLSSCHLGQRPLHNGTLCFKQSNPLKSLRFVVKSQDLQKRFNVKDYGIESLFLSLSTASFGKVIARACCLRKAFVRIPLGTVSLLQCETVASGFCFHRRTEKNWTNRQNFSV